MSPGKYTRRKMVVLTSTAAIMSLAGCASENGDGSDDADDTDDGDDAPIADDADDTGDAEPDDDDDDQSDAAYIDDQDDTVILAFGDTAELSNGITITTLDIHFEAELGDEDRPREPDEGNQWALVELHGENTSDEAERLPTPWMDFALITNGSQYDPTSVLDTNPYEEFDGGEIQPGIEREGVVVFEVPEELERADLEVVWHDDFLDANIDVRWSDEA